MTISVIQLFVLRIEKIWYVKISKRRKIDIVNSPSEKDQAWTSSLSVTQYRRVNGNDYEEDRIVDWTLCCLRQEWTDQKFECSTGATSSDPKSGYQELKA